MTTLQKALTSLGITREEEQIALLENMLLDGLFTQEEVWDSIRRVHHLSPIKPYGVENAHDTLEVVLQETNARDFNRFDAKKLLRADLSSGFLFQEDLEDWITYSRQTAFGRSKDMDYAHLPEDNRSEDVQERYYENARIMGRVAEVKAPEGAVYDESWLQCATRIRIVSRMESMVEHARAGGDIGEVRICAGERIASVSLDGITQKEGEKVIKAGEKEGEEYLLALAQKLGRTVGEPLLVPVRENLPNGARTINVEPRITEADIAADLAGLAVGSKVIQLGRAITEGYAGRADTLISTAEVIPAFIKKIQEGGFAKKQPAEDGKKHIRIMNVTDQPFIPRMHLQVERLVNKALREAGLDAEYQVDIDTIGKGCTKDFMHYIKSDAAAWAQQQHETMQQGRDRIRPLKELQFNNEELRKGLEVPPFPRRAEAFMRSHDVSSFRQR